MRISIQHKTHYRFDQPVWHGVQRLRLTPRDCAMQTVLGWQLSVDGGAIECSYEDHNRNMVSLISLGTGNGEITITGQGMIETYDKAGVVGAHTGFMPLWLLANPTELTKPGPKIRAMADKFAHDGTNTIAALHDVMAAVNKAVVYEVGHTGAHTTAEAALAAGKGVSGPCASVHGGGPADGPARALRRAIW
jgi:transglutaminase-like putative cysteine protease